MSQLQIGAIAPEFVLPAIDGRTFHSASAGAFALVFYKASCPTCQLTFPFLERIHEERAGQVRIIAVSQDEQAETAEFMKTFGIRFEVLLDEHPYDVSRSFAIENVPAIFGIGEDHRITLSDYGFSKATLSAIAGSEMFQPGDGLPAMRPG